MIIKKNISLLPYNTFGIDVKADYFIEYNSVDDLQEALKSDIVKSNSILAIGEGSNLLFLSDFNGVILHSRNKFISVLEENRHDILIEVGSGAIWDDFVVHCVENELYGIENLSLIPGQVGAAAVQNIGAYGVEVKDIISEVHAVETETGLLKIFALKDCEYGYRDSIFKNECKGKYIISSVVFRLSKLAKYCFDYQYLEQTVAEKGLISLSNVRETIIEIREAKLPNPKIQGNAGSFFKNPIVTKEQFLQLQEKYPDISHFHVSETEEKISAAWLISHCGWKGKHLGNAGVHDKQPLVIVNLGNAKGEEIANLASEIQFSVKQKFGVELYTEVNYISCKS